MRLIEQLSDHIREEIEDAETYIREASDCREKNPETAEVYRTLAEEELKHMDLLHNAVTKVIDAWKRSSGQEVPPVMQARYDILHKIAIGDANKVKLMIQLYKEAR